MKKLITIALALAFLTVSCSIFKTNNIYVDHSKEKDQFKKSNKGYKTQKSCKTWK